MFEIACYSPDNTLGVIGSENGIPFTFESEETAYDYIGDIQNSPDKPEFKLMWVRRCVGAYSQQPGSRCPSRP